MPLLTKILQWSNSLPDWQRDALRRLFQQGDLTPQDYDDLYTMLKATYSIPDSQNRKPIPLASSHIPATVSGGTVILNSMYNLIHVNQIASGQTLKFSPTGITVIYGGNGSGKSGYSRVLKRACRARDQSEDILTNANNPTERNSTPEATFDITIGTNRKTVKWVKGVTPPDELSTVAVFDSHCARAYLKEGEAAYLPYGMDIMVNLANKVIPTIKQMLNRESICINVDATPFISLRGETSVGRIIASLSNRTDTAVINKLATLSDTELSRIAELKTVLSEADPKIKADELILSTGRIKDVAAKVNATLRWVKDEAIERLKAIYNEALTSEEAEKNAAQVLQSGEKLLPGTGEQIWKSLFEAARKFSTEVAYHGLTFPHADEGAVCPLCQQPLTDSGARFKRFEKYIQDDAAKTAKKKRSELEAAITKIQQANITIELNEPLKVELSQLDQTVVPTIITFDTSIENRRSWMLNAVNIRCWDKMPQFAENPITVLRYLATKQLIAARIFKKAANLTKKAQLKMEYNELVARQNLKTNLEPVLALVNRMKSKTALENCYNGLDTGHISRESTKLAETVISSALEKSLINEFQMLGIDHIKTKLHKRTIRAKTHYSLSLALPTTAKLENILSEGEQRAISLGSFLAELQLGGHKGGIVFDDPVSSLDDDRRKHVAKRLVKEAARRQVIVFTHDTVFLGELLDNIEQQKTTSLVHHLEWANDIPGYINEGLPWGHQGYKERLNTLKQNCSKLNKAWPTHPNEDDRATICQQYSYLRATIERVIQDVVFNGVVKRYRDWIRVDSLNEIAVVTEANYKEIERLHKNCCNVTEAHDPSSGKNNPSSTPTELAKDIADLEAVIQAIKDARKSA